MKKALEDYQAIYIPSRNFATRTRIEYVNDLERGLENTVAWWRERLDAS